MPFIAMRRTDIPNGVLQVLDLVPNTSLRNSIYDPAGQTKYVNRLVNDTLGPLVSNQTTATYEGIAAYLLDVTADGVTTRSITVTQANATAAAIILRVNGGLSLTAANITTLLVAAGCGAGTTIVGAGGAGQSAGSVADLLKIVAGGTYVLPVGTTRNPGAARPAGTAGAFVPGTYRDTYDTGALAISFGAGELAVYKSAVFDYLGTSAAALTVYNNDGTLYA